MDALNEENMLYDDEELLEVTDENGEALDVARHPKQILKILRKIPDIIIN